MAISTDLQNPDPLLKLVAKVRSKVGAPHVIFDDSDYISDLEDVGRNVFRGAALRLLAIANSESYIQKVQETLELKTDGKALGDSYRASAKMLLAMVDDGDTTVTPTPTPRRGKCISPRRIDGYTPVTDCGEEFC